jgi:hypothetical protein
MASSKLIVVRIHPVLTTDGASFGSSLKGLAITVFDRAATSAAAGAELGSASFDAPDENRGVIVQHVSPPPRNADDAPGGLPFAAATAAIVIAPPVGTAARLLLKITRYGVGVAEESIVYQPATDVGVSLPLPPAPAGGDTPELVAVKTLPYMRLGPVSLYWALPVFDPFRDRMRPGRGATAFPEQPVR